MPNYEIRDEGRGPYAVFYCDQCSRAYPSSPIPRENTPEPEARGFMDRVRQARTGRSTQSTSGSTPPPLPQMTAEQVQDAWQEVQKSFRECPTCRQVMCVADFDMATGFCHNDSPGT